MTSFARRPLVAGNWKMNGLQHSSVELKRIIEQSAALTDKIDILVCPPATLIAAFAAKARGSAVKIGGQDNHAEAAGAFTGNISAEMLADAGATAVILGHSERRTHHRETDEVVRAKTLAAWRAGLMAVVCLGETREQREAGEALQVVGSQLRGSLPDGATGENLVVAYEPVWAIGTGLTPTSADVAEMHKHLRAGLIERFGSQGHGIRLLYGGSVKPSNARELLTIPDVDGALVGGASLKADEFMAIAAAYG